MNGHNGVCVNDVADVMDYIKKAQAKMQYYLKIRSEESTTDMELNDVINRCDLALSEAARLIGNLNVG